MHLLEAQNEAKQRCNRLKDSLESYQSQAVGKTLMNLLYNYCECTQGNIQQVYSLSCCCKSIQVGCPVEQLLKSLEEDLDPLVQQGQLEYVGTEMETETGTEMPLKVELYHKWVGCLDSRRLNAVPR